MTGHRALEILSYTARTPEIVRCAAETPQWMGVTGALLGFLHPAYPSNLRLRRGEPIALQELADLKTFWQIFARRVYRVSASDRTIVDIGANIGLFTLYAARQAPGARIFAVEPFPATFERLLQTVHSHRLRDKVICLNCAATGRSGIHLMRDVPLPSQRRSVVTFDPRVTGVKVPGKTLSELFQECRVERIDVLKMDIEGKEYELLLSTPLHVLRTIGRIAIEYHGHCAPYTKRQLFDHLGRAGFNITSDLHNSKGYGVAEALQTHPILSSAA